MSFLNFFRRRQGSPSIGCYIAMSYGAEISEVDSKAIKKLKKLIREGKCNSWILCSIRSHNGENITDTREKAKQFIAKMRYPYAIIFEMNRSAEEISKMIDHNQNELHKTIDAFEIREPLTGSDYRRLRL